MYVGKSRPMFFIGAELQHTGRALALGYAFYIVRYLETNGNEVGASRPKGKKTE